MTGSVTRAFTEPGTKHYSNREQDETNPDLRKLRTQRAFLEEAALNWIPRDRDVGRRMAKREEVGRLVLGTPEMPVRLSGRNHTQPEVQLLQGRARKRQHANVSQGRTLATDQVKERAKGKNQQ